MTFNKWVATIAIAMAGAGTAQANLLAAFDVDGDTGPTLSGYASLDGDLQTHSASQNGVTLLYTLSAAGDFGRDRGGGGVLTGNPREGLMRDFVFGNDSTNLEVDLSGLDPLTRYRVRTYGFDRTASNDAFALWFTGNSTLFGGNNDLITGHVNRTADAVNSYLDMFLTSDGGGNIELITRGSTGSSSIFNGLELYSVDSVVPVALFDVDQDGNVAPGATALNFTGATGIASAAGLTLTVTTDGASNLRSRGASANELVDDFVFAGVSLTAQLDGLTPGLDYELTLYNQDLNGNNGSRTSWQLDNNGALSVIRTSHYNNQAVGAADVTFLVTPSSSSITLTGAEVFAGDLAFFNGLSVSTIAAVPEPSSFFLLFLGVGALRYFVRRTSGNSHPSTN